MWASMAEIPKFFWRTLSMSKRRLRAFSMRLKLQLNKSLHRPFFREGLCGNAEALRAFITFKPRLIGLVYVAKRTTYWTDCSQQNYSPPRIRRDLWSHHLNIEKEWRNQ